MKVLVMPMMMVLAASVFAQTAPKPIEKDTTGVSLRYQSRQAEIERRKSELDVVYSIVLHALKHRSQPPSVLMQTAFAGRDYTSPDTLLSIFYDIRMQYRRLDAEEAELYLWWKNTVIDVCDYNDKIDLIRWLIKRLD